MFLESFEHGTLSTDFNNNGGRTSCCRVAADVGVAAALAVDALAAPLLAPPDGEVSAGG
jgi:hypothetical protein